jgi:hypothetical protein
MDGLTSVSPALWGTALRPPRASAGRRRKVSGRPAAAGSYFLCLWCFFLLESKRNL